jgi:hypothetical protein
VRREREIPAPLDGAITRAVGRSLPAVTLCTGVRGAWPRPAAMLPVGSIGLPRRRR